MRWTWIVPPGEGRADKRIHEALSDAACSRSRLQQLMEKAGCSRMANRFLPADRLEEGAEVEIDFPDETTSELVPEPISLEILYEDAELVVVNKPQGLTVHPSPTQLTGTLVHGLLHRYGTLAPAGGSLRPGIVHRIDKDTSGAIVVARTDLAYHALVSQFAAHSIDRAYWAICYGTPKDRTGRIEGAIARSQSDRRKMALTSKGGKPAATRYRVLSSYGRPKPYASWLELTLETGRTHQIRVHLTSLGHSILGDPSYGMATSRQPKWLALPEAAREAAAKLHGQALHARVLGFMHPATKERVRFEAEPTREFRELVETLERG